MIHEDLGELWYEAEWILPDDARLVVQKRPENGPYEAYAQSPTGSLGFAYGSTPVEALRNLINHLKAARERARDAI